MKAILLFLVLVIFPMAACPQSATSEKVTITKTKHHDQKDFDRLAKKREAAERKRKAEAERRKRKAEEARRNAQAEDNVADSVETTTKEKAVKSEKKAEQRALPTTPHPSKTTQKSRKANHASTSKVTEANLDGFIEKAESGDVEAQLAVADYYLAREMYSDAARWYRKAADAGNAEAQYQLGKLYKEGLGVSRDLKLAQRWLQKAADNRHAEAAVELDSL